MRTSALRTLGAYANVFATESFMDELAEAAGVDPVEFRLAHLKDPRARGLIRRVASTANWKPGEKGDGRRGRGIGFARYKNVASYNAVIAEVEVDRASGVIKVARIWTAADAGLVINPDGLGNQIEGGIVQSISWTLHEEVRFDRNAILAHDWRTYPILRCGKRPRSVERVHAAAKRASTGRRRGITGADSRGDRQRVRATPPANACATCRSRRNASRPRSAEILAAGSPTFTNMRCAESGCRLAAI